MAPRRPLLLVLGVGAFLACSAQVSRTKPPAPGPAGSPSGSIVDACRADLARRRGIEPGLVEVVSATDIVWPSAALGLERPGETFAAVRTPGKRVILRIKPRLRDYVYATGGGTFRYAGPAALWSASALTIEDTEADPNLNGRLVQYSMIGTNRAVLLEGVDDFYPQDDGSLFAKRRTSRSGHDLLYLARGRAASEASRVAAAFDFADAVVSPDGTLGAALARTGPELAWQLALIPLPSEPRTERRVALPEKVRPERLRWAAGEPWPSLILIGSGEGGQRVRFGLMPRDTVPKWESLPSYVASDEWDFVLSKSHSLSVYGIETDGRPAVKVEYVWWNRPPEEIATIPGLRLDGFAWAEGREFVFLSGRTDAGHCGLVVDIDTGEVVAAAEGRPDAVKLFKAAPRSPMPGAFRGLTGPYSSR